MADSALPPSRFGAGHTSGNASSTPVLQAARRLNPLATVSFAAALVLGLVAAPVTLALSYVAQRQIRTSGHSGAALAKAAMFISVVYLVIGIVVIGLHFYLTGGLGAGR